MRHSALQTLMIAEDPDPMVRRRMYRDHVHAVAFRVIGQTFATLPKM